MRMSQSRRVRTAGLLAGACVALLLLVTASQTTQGLQPKNSDVYPSDMEDLPDVYQHSAPLENGINKKLRAVSIISQESDGDVSNDVHVPDLEDSFSIASDSVPDVPFKIEFSSNRIKQTSAPVFSPLILKSSSDENNLINNSRYNFPFKKNKFGSSLNLSDISLVRMNRDVQNSLQVLTNVEPLRRPSNVSPVESPHYPWGSHAFGPLEAYTVTPLGLRWNAYFYEEAIAVVLEDKTRTVLNCTLLEVIPSHEQRAALHSLGQVMSLVPLTLTQMVLLNSHCQSPRERFAPRPKSKRLLGEKNIPPERLLGYASTALMGLLPGTAWCGLRDRASRYHQLGERREVDACCRTHDHCPLKIRAGATRYGATNNGFTTVSHCLCDEAFRLCLQDASKYDEMANLIGNVFFNIMGLQCLSRPKPQTSTARKSNRGPEGFSAFSDVGQQLTTTQSLQDSYYTPRLECSSTDSENGCRQWLKNPKSLPLKLSIIKPNFRFKTDE